MSSIFLSLLIWASSLMFVHDIHVSICDVKYNTETTSIQISLRIFLDDLEASIQKNNHEELKILTHKESLHADSLINSYVHRHLNILTDGKSHQMQFIGKELSEDFMAMWVYFEIPDIRVIKALEIKNDILMEMYDDQQNIVTVKKNRNKVSHWLFDQKRKVESVNF